MRSIEEVNDNARAEETKTGKIIRLAMEKGDKGIVDLMGWIWGDSVYDRLYGNLDVMSEEDKDEMLEELENELGMGKTVLYIDKEAWVDWYFDNLTKDGVIEDLISPTGTGEVRLIDILQGVGYLPLDLVENKEDVRKEDINGADISIEEIEEPGEKYRLEWDGNRRIK